MRNQILVVIVIINIALASGYKSQEDYDSRDDDADYREKYGFQPSKYYKYDKDPVEPRQHSGYSTEEDSDEDYPATNKYYRTGFDPGSDIKQSHVQYSTEVDHHQKKPQKPAEHSVLRGNNIFVSYKQGEQLGHVNVPQSNKPGTGQSNYYNKGKQQIVELIQDPPQPSKDYVLYKNKQAEKAGQNNKYKVTQFGQGNSGYADQTNYFNYVTQSAHKIMQGNTKITPFKAPTVQSAASSYQIKPNVESYPQPYTESKPLYSYKTIVPKTQVPITYTTPTQKVPLTYPYQPKEKPFYQPQPQHQHQHPQQQQPQQQSYQQYEDQKKIQVAPISYPLLQTVQQPYKYKFEDERKVPLTVPASTQISVPVSAPTSAVTGQYSYKQPYSVGESKLPQHAYSQQTYQTIQLPETINYEDKNQEQTVTSQSGGGGGYPVPFYVVVEKPVPVYLRSGRQHYKINQQLNQQQQQQQHFRKAQLVQQRYDEDGEETSQIDENDKSQY